MHMEGGALAPSRLEHAASAAAQSRSHAQAKAQGVADKTHARFSPSAANRRIHCPPSLLLEEQFEEGESVYAAEGTAGHGELGLGQLPDELQCNRVSEVGFLADDFGEVVGDENGCVAVALVVRVGGQMDDSVVCDAAAAGQVE